MCRHSSRLAKQYWQNHLLAGCGYITRWCCQGNSQHDRYCVRWLRPSIYTHACRARSPIKGNCLYFNVPYTGTTSKTATGQGGGYQPGRDKKLPSSLRPYRQYTFTHVPALVVSNSAACQQAMCGVLVSHTHMNHPIAHSHVMHADPTTSHDCGTHGAESQHQGLLLCQYPVATFRQLAVKSRSLIGQQKLGCSPIHLCWCPYNPSTQPRRPKAYDCSQHTSPSHAHTCQQQHRHLLPV